MTAEELIESFIKIRDKKSQLKTAYESEAARYTEVQDRIEGMLLAKFNELGAQSLKTASGTAYVSVKSRANLADWDAYKAFISGQEDPFMFVEHRVSQSAVDQYRAANDDIPPGVNYTEIRSVNFRRS